MGTVYWVVHVNSGQHVKWFNTWEAADRCATGLGWCKVVKY